MVCTPEVSFTAVQLGDVIQSAFMSAGVVPRNLHYRVDEKEKSEKFASVEYTLELNYIFKGAN